MNKEMTEYKKRHFLGGMTKKSGKFKHNILADKLLKKSMYSRFYFNKKKMASITWDVDKFDDDSRICSGKKRTISDLLRIRLLRKESLDKNGWFENPPRMPKIPDSVSKLKDTKRVKFKIRKR